MDLYSKINAELEHYKKDKAFRFLKKQEAPTSNTINLSSNDYLGIAQSKKNLEEFYFENPNIALTASSSRLLDGNHNDYDKVEKKLSDLYKSESALFFNSGYHLNIGVLPSLTKKTDLILADKLVHTSIIEALKLSPAKNIRYKHLDYIQLEYLLKKYSGVYDNIFIVSESVFSMDGDFADLQKLVNLKNKYKTYLYIDEAHAVGAIGTKGLGLAEKTGLINEIDFLVGTMGKALASVGAYLICKANVKSYLINNCKSLIYTTALPPINVAWSSFIIDKSTKLNKERKLLSEISTYIKDKLTTGGIKVIGSTYILALIIGENSKCLDLSTYLQENNIKVQAIRPPTVPTGTSRIRISLHVNLTYAELDKVAQLIITYANRISL